MALENERRASEWRNIRHWVLNIESNRASLLGWGGRVQARHENG